MELSRTHVRYLLTIYTQAGEVSTVSAVARALGVSKPSVTRMLGILMEKGLLVQERYGKVCLTAAGKAAAQDYRERTERLRLLIPRMQLNLTEEELEETACLLASSLPASALPNRAGSDAAVRQGRPEPAGK